MAEDNLPAYLGRAQAEPGNPALDERHRQPQPANLPTEASEEPPPESAQRRQLPPPILNATPRTAVPATNMEPAEEEAKDYEQNERRGTDYLPPPLEVPREPGRPATRTRRQPPSPPLPPPSSDPAPNAQPADAPEQDAQMARRLAGKVQTTRGHLSRRCSGASSSCICRTPA